MGDSEQKWTSCSHIVYFCSHVWT